MKRALKTALIAMLGAFIGYIVAGIFGDEKIYGYVICFMGFPFGWSFFNKYIGIRIISTNIAFMAMIFLVKAALSIMACWVILTIELVRSLVEVFKKGKE